MFVDYNQNARDRTVASGYSVRPTPDARVSCALRVGRGARRRAGRPAARHGARRGCGRSATRPPTSTREPGSLDRCSTSRAATRRSGLGDAPWPPHFPKQKDEPKRVQPSRDRDRPTQRGRAGDPQPGGPPPGVTPAACSAASAPSRAPGRATSTSSTTDGLVGAHVAPKQPLEAAAGVGADCVQIFLSDPQGWKKPPPRDDAQELRDSTVPVYVHAPYLINVCSPQQQHPLRLAQDPPADLRGRRRRRRRRGDRPRRPRRGRGRGGSRPLGADARDARVRGDRADREHGRRRQRRRAPLRRAGRLWEAVARATTDVELGFCFDTCHAHAAGEELSTRSSACSRSSGRSTCCTSTTRATRPAPAPTATPTSARARSARRSCGR